jgi:hypothetical protein
MARLRSLGVGKAAGNARVSSQHMQSLHGTNHSMITPLMAAVTERKTKSPCERCKNTRIAHEVHREMSSSLNQRSFSAPAVSIVGQVVSLFGQPVSRID